MKKLLIFAEPYGMGHIKAAQNLREAFKLRDRRVGVRIMSAGELISKPMLLITAMAYNRGMELRPNVWGMVYKMSGYRISQYPKEAAYSFAKPIIRMGPVKKILDISKPDAVVCTHPFSAMGISSLNIDIPIVVVVTDYEFHPFWVVPGVDYYITPCKEVTDGLLRYKVPMDRIKQYGIPVSPAFSSLKRRAWPNDRIHLLIMGGGVGVGLNAVDRLAGLDADITVVTGRNESARRRLEAEYANSPNIKVMGFVEDVSKLMASADILISKAGGLTTSEAMAAGLPMVIPNVLPGQEKGNAEYIEKNGAGIVSNFDRLRMDICDIINDREKLTQMRKNALSIGKQDSALMTADMVLSLIDSRGNSVEKGL
ncbi:MGDG synthase family glycosyltransferase [Calorimonas adulescens]|jgi:Glycosyltransferase family 28 C-terminal domain./Monogalactosyldiacylglycerol (MGDG) synthase.|uniref:Glycosyltransferase n=1 Tax=Calorimonas adulescens TaxID=2606906 RepID=A0A5D8QA46_9THEO|nr:glycosyltransferase [Calorimonas adulescens]TZE80636.1 glycosyltransferase [Calorimonas adulescens]